MAIFTGVADTVLLEYEAFHCADVGSDYPEVLLAPGTPYCVSLSQDDKINWFKRHIQTVKSLRIRICCLLEAILCFRS